MMILGQQETSEGVVQNITSTAPYIAIFSLVVVLIRIIVNRAETTDTSAAATIKAAEERMKGEIERAIIESESKCNARLEAAEVECASQIEIVNNQLRLVARGLDIIAKEYPHNVTLQLLISTLTEEG